MPREFICVCKFCKEGFIARTPSKGWCDKKECQDNKLTVRRVRDCKYKLDKNYTITGIKIKAYDGTFSRECLKCEKKFITHNRYIRLCKTCRSISYYNESDYSGGVVR
ncbi:MAG: hypothetical protein US52_C0053G0005 [candidate division WS6 bacterium GW2011_GWA2_37_6]|uniref:Uncharacterized protein n=1 Tax=candidate division WS6 bacterium GW2011_GWA2_37_6 TaxID=1619087 RepID=A0A0G0GWZ7_9BACT|nr:MAG: hypothetical protein US52_C0053G0005 [candidate division WS6 bacterium GW2011_GWA2_37_6]